MKGKEGTKKWAEVEGMRSKWFFIEETEDKDKPDLAGAFYTFFTRQAYEDY